MPATKFEKGKVKEQIDPKVLGVLSAAFGYKISGVDDLDYEEYHNELREAMERGKDTLSPAQMGVLSKERTRIRAQKSVYKTDFKKTTMTAADIKKGSAMQLAENSALSLYKGGVGKSPESNEETLGDIDDKLDDLLETLREDGKLEKDAAAAARKKAEQEKRAKKEKNLERWESLKKTTSTILKPFTSLWDKIWGFLKNVLLGNFLLKIIDYFADPKNQSKLTNIFRFLKDWWPPLLASYLLFGNSFGRMMVKITALIARSTIRLLTFLIPKLIAAIAKIKAMKIGKMMTGLLGGGKLKGLTGLFSLGAGAFEGGGLVQEFAEGGEVRGPGGVDKVPAKLTAGEFVMSKGAVQKFGVDTLSGMNAAGGGTNIPKFPEGLGGGGGGTNALTEQAKVKTFGSALGDFFSGDDGRSRRMTDLEKSQRMEEGGLVAKDFYSWQRQAFNPSPKRGSDPMAGTAEARKRLKEIWMEGRSGNVTIENYRQYVELGGNARKSEYYKKILERNKKREFNAKFAKTLTKSELDDVNKERALGGEKPLNIAPTATKTTEVKPPVKNNVVKNYIAEKENSDVQNNANTDPVPGGEGTGIPEFDPEKYVSPQKLKTLGIV